jgi:hypothetical protein
MTEKFDWAAPIEPGHGMLGLTLGLSLSSIRARLGENGSVIMLPSSPKLTVDYSSKEGAVFLRATDLNDCKYDWQNIVARLIFEEDVLVGIVVLGGQGNEAYSYKGKLFGKIGLGSPVSDLLEFGSIEYDDVEEVFFSNQWNGIEIGGAGACDLSFNPRQLVTFLKVYRAK